MTTLTDRYVHATVRSVPEARRDEIARELRASIHDMVGDRLENGEDHVTAERAVLTELGNPDRLAIQYTDRPNHLIGPRYFVIYQRLVLRLLLWIPVPVGIVVGAIELVDSGWSAAIGEGISTAITVALHVAFWTTLSFAVLERTGGETGLPEWTVDSLPDLPRQQQVTLSDTVSGVVILGILAGVLVVQHFRTWVGDDTGGDVPLLDPDLWSFWLPFLIAVPLACAVLEVVKYRVGWYSWTVVAGVTATSLAWLLPVAWLATEDRLLSREFVEAVGMSAAVLDRVNVGIVVVALLIEVGTVIDAVIKNHQSRRGRLVPDPSRSAHPA